MKERRIKIFSFLATKRLVNHLQHLRKKWGKDHVFLPKNKRGNHTGGFLEFAGYAVLETV